MKIGLLSKKVGLAASTIRYYESIGLIPKPLRSSGRRIYRENSVLLLRVIQKTQQLGFKLKEIKILMSGFNGKTKPKKWNKMAGMKILELEIKIKESKEMLSFLKDGIQCECLEIEFCQHLLKN